MMNDAGIEKIVIKGLFGKRNITLDFNSEVKIIVGENGLGKTTILNILNEILKGSPENIINFPLDSVEVKLSGQTYPFLFSQEGMKKFIEARNHVLEDFDKPGLEKLINRIFDSKIDLSEEIDQDTLEGTISDFLRSNPDIYNEWMFFGGSPEKYIIEWIGEFPSIFSFKKEIRDRDFQVVFLPTYRRIEADLNKVVADDPTIFIPNRRGSVTENISVPSAGVLRQVFSNNSHIKFGMKDIAYRIDSILKKISTEAVKGYNEVSSKMVAHLLDAKKETLAPQKIYPNQLRVIVERLGSSMSENEKLQLTKIIEDGEIKDNDNLSYYLSALSEVYKRTEKYDNQLKSFCEALNKFLYDKKFVYDESHIKFNLFFKNDNNHASPVSLEKLSSGEKQLIALFARAYLSINKKLVFIIDEPELSLSLIWQKILLPSLKAAPATSLIIAATHSPFIFDNELREYTVGGAEYASPISK